MLSQNQCMTLKKLHKHILKKYDLKKTRITVLVMKGRIDKLKPVFKSVSIKGAKIIHLSRILIRTYK